MRKDVKCQCNGSTHFVGAPECQYQNREDYRLVNWQGRRWCEYHDDLAELCGGEHTEEDPLVYQPCPEDGEGEHLWEHPEISDANTQCILCGITRRNP